MRLGLVAGTVIAARKDVRLEGTKLLLVRMIDATGTETSDELIAIDTVGAGEGETVIVSEGSSARRSVGSNDSPTDAAVVGIVDHWYNGDTHHSGVDA